MNPDLVPGGTGETAIADFCSEWLAARGFDVHRLEKHPGRPSLVAAARGPLRGDVVLACVVDRLTDILTATVADFCS
ncbi:hypothetical protein [Streptomyces sp. NPDC017958]|uniref:hypothetical protein n=1 Tax=Streptomyces sp. NPDC017958 TaxID=3365021 RepID=UPI0037A6C5A4